jgi:hypothetical protein
MNLVVIALYIDGVLHKNPTSFMDEPSPEIAMTHPLKTEAYGVTVLNIDGSSISTLLGVAFWS